MLFIAIILSFFSCEVDTRAEEAFKESSSLVFSFTNSKVIYDKNIILPSGSRIREGDMIIKSVQVAEVGDKFIFKVEMNSKISNEYGNSKGWDREVIDIYLFANDNRGHRAAISGRNGEFNQKWNKAIVLSPRDNLSLRTELLDPSYNVTTSDYEIDIRMANDIVIPKKVAAKNNTFFFAVSSSKIGDVMDDLAGIQALVLQYDDSSIPGVKEIKQYSRTNSFGNSYLSDKSPNFVSYLFDGEYVQFKDNIVKKRYAVIPVVENQLNREEEEN